MSDIAINSKQIDLVPLSKIKLNPKNRNIHTPEQIARAVEIIKYNGFRRPCTISNQSGLLVCGHGRYHAAKLLGMKLIPCIYQDYDSPEHEFADAIADNALDKWAELDYAGIADDVKLLNSDFKLDMMGIRDFPGDDELDYTPGCADDELPTHTKPRCKPGQIWKLGAHRLMCADATVESNVAKLTGGEVADICFTDPPYGIEYQSNHRKKKFEKLKNDDRILTEWVEPAKKFTSGWFIFFYGWQRTREWMDVGDKIGKLTNILIWKKSAAMGDLTGSFAPTYEFALAFNRGKKLREGIRKSAVFEHNTESGGTFEHPTQKPVSLLVDVLNGLPKGSVLDVFGGSGSTMIACEKTKQNSFIMEIDPAFCDVILARWELFTGKTAELVK